MLWLTEDNSNLKENAPFQVLLVTPEGLDNDYANSVALQPDDKIVVTGSVNNGKDREITVVRSTGSGMPDSTFGTNGIVTTPIGSGNDDDFAVARYYGRHFLSLPLVLNNDLSGLYPNGTSQVE